MPSDKRNSITAKATASLIFSLFDVALARQVPFGILQYVQCIRHRLTSVLLCVPFIFADRERCSFLYTSIPPSVPVSYTRSNHLLKLFHLPTRIDVYKYSFLPRTIIQWNQLLISDIDKIDIDTFKNNLIGIVYNCNGH